MFIIVNIVLVYTNEDQSTKRFNAQKYYLPQGMIKICNVITKTFITKQLIPI